MPDIVIDGMVRVGFAPTIANINAPTTTELNAGILLSPVMTADGLQGFQASTATVDNSSLESQFDTNTIGRDSFSGTKLRLKKQSGTDTAYTTLTRGTTGYIVVRRGILASTAWTSGQAVEVYPITCAQTGHVDYEKNTVQRYDVGTPITSSPALRAAIA